MLCSYVELSDETQPSDVEYYAYTEFPAIKIARLAIDRRARGNGLGKALVNICIAISIENIMPNIGCRFIVVDSKLDAVKFYQKRGFKVMMTDREQDSDTIIMYLDLVNMN